MKKNEARKFYRVERGRITPVQKQKLDDLLLIQFQKLPLPPLQAVLTYMPIDENNEIDTFPLSRFLEFSNPGLLIAYPKINPGTHEMQAIAVDEATRFVPNGYNIYEPAAGTVVPPEELDLVIVPALVCDKQGNRVGYGKGFYDRYLKQCRRDCFLAGISYFEPVVEIEDANEFDVPLKYCITPQTVYVF
jgi:5-formyltetrahydrofolate cyclo-ligase